MSDEQLLRSDDIHLSHARDAQRYEKYIRGIAFLELLGAGLLVTMFFGGGGTGTNSPVYLIVFAPVAVTVWGGLYLWQLKDSGFRLTLTALALQVLFVDGPKFAYQYYACFRIWVGWFEVAKQKHVFGFDWGGRIFMRYSPEPIDAHFGVGANLLAVLLIVLLLRWKKLRDRALFQNKKAIDLSNATGEFGISENESAPDK